ncbi:MAG: cadherin-like beta sandwich domain-containing protein, partial [Sphingobacteriales bacterium]
MPPGGSAGANVVIASAFTPSPSQQMGIDFSKNLAYIYEGTPASRAIKSVDLTNGSVQTVLSLSGLPSGITVKTISVTQLPYVTTASATSITGSSAVLGGTVIRSDAGVTSRGLVYSSSNQTPTIGGTNVIQAVNGSGTGIFSATISSLSPVTTYYVRSYATSSAGTAYGTVTSFTTKSNDANLNSFALNNGTLSPTFASGTTSYTASVANSVSVIEVTPGLSNSGASVRVNNSPVSSGSAFPVALNVGSNTINAVVTAADGTTTKTYTFTITRAASNDANLSAITVNNGNLTPTFDTNTTSYTVSVPNSQTALNISATVRQPNATFKVSGAPVASGQNISYNFLRILKCFQLCF